MAGTHPLSILHQRSDTGCNVRKSREDAKLNKIKAVMTFQEAVIFRLCQKV